jgi:hypothetical protein
MPLQRLSDLQDKLGIALHEAYVRGHEDGHSNGVKSGEDNRSEEVADLKQKLLWAKQQMIQNCYNKVPDGNCIYCGDGVFYDKSGAFHNNHPETCPITIIKSYTEK